MRPSWPLSVLIPSFLLITLAAAILITLILQSNWVGLGAISTAGAVLWAIYHQWFTTYLNRPRLEIMPYKQEPPFFRSAAEIFQGTDRVSGIGYYINIHVENTGRTIARNCQSLVTAIGRFEKNVWRKEKSWFAWNLRWSFQPDAEKVDVAPNRPYAISLGRISTREPDTFLLSVLSPTTGQKFFFQPGRYCFEVSIIADETDPVKKYFHVYWDGGCNEDFEEVKEKTRVFSENHPPWPHDSFTP